MDGTVRRYIDEHSGEFFAALKQWLTIPSISADPARSGDVRESARWLADHLHQAGFPVAEVWETGTPAAPGLPAVFAEWPAAAPNARTVLIYGHHDVQPVEPLSEWDSPPFEPVELGGELLARGASDDKGQVLFHALGVAAWVATHATHGASAPPLTIKLIVEGEEESGSPHFADLLRRERERLACDVIVVSDTTMWAADVPSMCVGMRGLIDAEIDVYGPERDLHSGSFGGGVPNPLQVLAGLLADLHDADGRVALPGFYDKVAELTPAMRDQFAKLPFDQKAWLAAAGNSGVWGGHIGHGGKTIIPREAHAKLSFRLVAHQDPADVADMLRQFVAQRTPPGVDIMVSCDGPGVRASFSPIDSPAVAAGRRAMERAFGCEVLFSREGGSGPEADLSDILDAPLVFIAVGLDEDRIHAPNERVDMALLLKGAETAAYLWDELATLPAGR
jgi:acetylornithine deacetylase/succinyl-diaminopimelate desuccinylase-like protein